MWDLHHTPLDIPPTYPIAATYHQTAPAALKQQHDLSLMAYVSRQQVMAMQQEVQKGKNQAKTEEQKKAIYALQTSLNSLSRTFNAIFGVLQDSDMLLTR